jgi:uncharacterized DUF497 family protein
MFEWDEAKNLANIAKHGIAFEDVVGIFAGFTLSFPDTRFEYGEVRRRTLGVLDNGLVIAVIHTLRSDRIRIISARRASREERRLYHAKLASRPEPSGQPEQD